MDVSSTPSTKNELIINNFFELFPAFPSQQANNVFAGQKIVVFFAHTALHFPNLFFIASFHCVFAVHCKFRHT